MRWFSLFWVLFMLVGCANNEPTTGIFRGYYQAGEFEVSAFLPCDQFGSPGNGNGYWLTPRHDSFYERYAHLFGSPAGAFPMVYVRFEGTLSPYKKNGYGHMSMYDHEITVEKLLEMELANNQCQTK